MTPLMLDLTWLFGGVFALLLVATGISAYLRQRYSADGTNTVIENLNARIMAWWAMVILMGIAFLGGKAGVIILFGFCSFAALREFMTLTTSYQSDHLALVAAFFIILPTQYYFVWQHWYSLHLH